MMIKPQRRVVNIDELPVVGSGLIEAKRLVQDGRERVPRGLDAGHQALASRGQIGNECNGPPLTARSQNSFEEFALHASGST